MADDRKDREREFHDHAFEHEARAPVSKFYTVVGESRKFYESLLARSRPKVAILEYGCGQGSSAFWLGERAAVTGIDISPVAVAQAQAEADRQGLSSVTFQEMDAEALTFPPRSFDLVCGSGILHHLDIPRALSEVARVLAPEGEAVFYEPLGHNPLINAYRKRTPQFRSADEHPLRLNDLRAAQDVFGSVQTRFFHIAALAAVPFRSTRLFRPLLAFLEALDSILLMIPPLRRFAWVVVIRCREPIRRDVTSREV